MAGMQFDMGLCCTLALHGGTKLVMSSGHGAQFAAEFFALAVGVADPVSTAICIINAYQHFEFSIGNDEIMQKLPLKSVVFIRKVPFILHIAVRSQALCIHSGA